MDTKKIIAGAIVGGVLGLLAAVAFDLDKYAASLKRDRDAKFFWKLAITRWAKGFLFGVGGGITTAARVQSA